MSSDPPLVVRLAVSVPRILLPGLQPASEQGTETNTANLAQPTTRPAYDLPGEEIELQVQLLIQENSSFQPTTSTIDATSRLAYTLPFRLFQLNIPLQDSIRVCALRILRWRNRSRNQQQYLPVARNKDNGQLYVSEELAFTLKLQHMATPADRGPLVPGLNQIVILRDPSGMPTSYSIDGAES